jgi:multidrug efflux pump subunit AcrA (membrane-fusion protein)
MLQKFGLPAFAVGALCFALYHVVTANQNPPKLEPPVTPARSPYGKGVSAAGIVEPETENISVGTHLPGIVDKVCVKVGDKVMAGQPLFRLDRRQLEAERMVRQAALQAAEAQLAKLQAMPRPSERPPLEARLRETRANLADKVDAANRARRLYASRANSEEERIRAEQAEQVAREQFRKAEADLQLFDEGAWKPDLVIAQASVAQQKAMLEQTATELDRLCVQVPALPVSQMEVLQVNVRPGEFVNALGGTAYIVLGSTQRLHVRVDIDEHDIHRFDPAAVAKAMLRGDPKQEYPLSFVRVEPYVVPKRSLTGDNTERVDTRVLQVIYALGSGPRPLFVGQQVDVYIEDAVKKD